MKRYWTLLFGMAVACLALFGAVEALHLPWIENPRLMLDPIGTVPAALVVIGLLIADVFLPIPSSLLMVASGALFGIAGGFSVSMFGALCAAAVGFAVGRRGGAALHRFVGEEESRRADHLLRRWGLLAVVASRPVPILAEGLAIFAGASPLRWRPFLLASLLGNLPAAALYAITGATARSLDNAFLIFGLVLLVTGIVWWAGRRLGGESDLGEQFTSPGTPSSSSAQRPPGPGH